MSGGIKLKASVLIRTNRGTRFPRASFAEALLPARASLTRDAERAFSTQTDPVTGRSWPKRKHHYTHKPLQKTGALRTAVLTATAAAHITGSSITATVTTPGYAVYQQRGTKTIAARRFMGASIGTIRIVKAGLLRASKRQAVHVLLGK